MMFRAAIVLIALAIPAFAQRGGAHAGSVGSRGFAGHAGFSAPSAFSRSAGSARPAQPARYAAIGGVRFLANRPSNYTSRPVSASGNRFMAPRPAYRSMGAGSSRTWNNEGDRGRFEARRGSFENWYVNNYPAWPGYGYPYAIDPGFYDWGDSDNSAPDNSAPDNSASDQGGAAPYSPAPYADYGYGVPGETPQEGFPGEIPPASAQGQQRVAPGPTVPSASVAEQPLTVIFKSGRAPVKMQNYMMTGRVLTNLDPRNYEEIPTDQIDVAATQRVNSAAGVGFEIPGASRD